MHMACMGAEMGPLAVVSDSAATCKAKLMEAGIREWKRQHACFWKLQGRIEEVGWVKSHLTVKHGIAAGFKKEYYAPGRPADRWICIYPGPACEACEALACTSLFEAAPQARSQRVLCNLVCRRGGLGPHSPRPAQS